VQLKVSFFSHFIVFSDSRPLVEFGIKLVPLAEPQRSIIWEYNKIVLCFTCSEDVSASITAQSEVVVMAVGTIRFVILASKRTIHQRHFAVNALEAVLMPVLVLVRQILQDASHSYTTIHHGPQMTYCRPSQLPITTPVAHSFVARCL